MAAMPPEVQKAFNESKNAVIATSTPDGQPNAAPVGMKKVVDDETVYVSDQFFKKTLANIKANQKVSVAFWGEGGAYQIHGTAAYVDHGTQFEGLKAWADGVFEAMGAPMRAKGGALIHVDEVFTSAPGPTAGDKIA